jgi:recombination protein RecA
MEKPKGQISPEALAKLQKIFGKENITTFADKPIENIERIPSGSMTLDAALGGGYPLGRIIEIYGPESSGKSSTCLHLRAQAQQKGRFDCLVRVG